jgi:hypothetical protein
MSADAFLLPFVLDLATRRHFGESRFRSDSTNLQSLIALYPSRVQLSKINKSKGEPGQGTTSRLITMAKQLGPAGLFTVRFPTLTVIHHRARLLILSLANTSARKTGYRCQVVHDRYLDRRSVHDLRRHQASFGSQGRCRDPEGRQVIIVGLFFSHSIDGSCDIIYTSTVLFHRQELRGCKVPSRGAMDRFEA